jgi:transposase-like protein
MSANISISGETQRRTRTRRWFPQEYKDQVVAWYFATGQPVAQAAEELGLPESTLRDWIRRAEKAPAASSSAFSNTASDPAPEEETEIAWHGEPEEPFVTSPGSHTAATWIYSPARLEALLVQAPPIAEVAYKLGVTESVLKGWVRSAAGEFEPAATMGDDDPLAEDVVVVLSEEPAPSVVSEPEPEHWTLVWRPPAD